VTPQRCSPNLANLLRRPAKPAKGRGRIQLAAQRVLWLFGTATTSDVINYAYAHRLVILGERRRNTLNVCSRRAMKSIGAVKVRRLKASRGCPWVWKLPPATRKPQSKP